VSVLKVAGVGGRIGFFAKEAPKKIIAAIAQYLARNITVARLKFQYIVLSFNPSKPEPLLAAPDANS